MTSGRRFTERFLGDQPAARPDEPCDLTERCPWINLVHEKCSGVCEVKRSCDLRGVQSVQVSDDDVDVVDAQSGEHRSSPFNGRSAEVNANDSSFGTNQLR
jgi:hypothetical protein